MWAGWGPASSSAPVPVDPVPDDPVPVPVPFTDSEDDGDLSFVSSDHPDLPVPSYPSLTVDDIPRRSRTKHTKRLSTQPTNCLSVFVAQSTCNPKVQICLFS